MKRISLLVFALALAATPALAKKYIPGCIPSPSQDAPPCEIKDEPAGIPSALKPKKPVAPVAAETEIDTDAAEPAPAPEEMPPLRSQKIRTKKAN